MPSDQPPEISEPQAVPSSGKRRKKVMLIAIAIVAILVVAALGYLVLKKERFSFTVFEGTNITTYHYRSSTETKTSGWEWTNDEPFYVGEPMDFWIRPFNGGNGTIVLTSAASEVTGFTYSHSSPALPVTLPNTDDPNEGIQVTLTFATPSTGYSGPFHLILHYDWYPYDLFNNITSVTETQIITAHTSDGEIMETLVSEHPESIGKYRTGTMMTFTEHYQYQGSGRCNITSIVANTTGFSFVSCAPSIPLRVPNATQPWLAMSLNFSSPSFQYDGAFSYIVYIDIYYDSPEPQYHHLTSVCEIQYVTSYFGMASHTTRYVMWHNETAGDYLIGEAMNITEPYWNIGTGVMSITGIVANTTGFSLAGTSPPLPMAIPNSPDGSTNATIVISFAMPASQYIGPFEYVVYMDDHLD